MPTKESERVMRWQRKNRKRVRAANRHAWKKNKSRYNEKRNQRSFRFRKAKKPGGVTPAEFSIVHADTIRRPTYRFVDEYGKEHVEKWETAEELAARYK